MTDRLSEIDARAEAATPGPWETCGDEIAANHNRTGTVGGLAIARAYCNAKTNENAAFIAHAREDVLFLLGEIERLKKHQCAPTEEWHGGVCPQAAKVAADFIEEVAEMRKYQRTQRRLYKEAKAERDEARAQALDQRREIAELSSELQDTKLLLAATEVSDVHRELAKARARIEWLEMFDQGEAISKLAAENAELEEQRDRARANLATVAKVGCLDCVRCKDGGVLCAECCLKEPVSELVSENAELKEEIESMRASLQRALGDLAAMDETLDQRDAEIERLKSEIAQTKLDGASLVANWRALKERTEGTRAIVAELEARFAELQAKCEQP